MTRRGILAALAFAMARVQKMFGQDNEGYFTAPVPWTLEISVRRGREVLTGCRPEGVRGEVLCDPVRVDDEVLVVKYGTRIKRFTGNELMDILEGKKK
jgi:hypothetical protein